MTGPTLSPRMRCGLSRTAWDLELFEYGVGAGLRYAENMRSIEITGPNEISVISNVSIPEMHRYTSRGSGTASVSAVFPRRPNLYDEAGELATPQPP